MPENDERRRDEGTPLWKLVLGGVLVYVSGSFLVDAIRDYRARRRRELEPDPWDWR